MSVLLDGSAWIEDLSANDATSIPFFGGLASMLTAIYFAHDILKSEVNEQEYPFTAQIARQISNGAESFLQAEYQSISFFVVIVFIIICVTVAWQTAVCFVFGAFLSAMSGYMGMRIATKANVRTTLACANPINPLQAGLAMAFKSGAVMALTVVSFGLLGICISFLVLWGAMEEEAFVHLPGFAFGASSIALFARVGGIASNFETDLYKYVCTCRFIHLELFIH